MKKQTKWIVTVAAIVTLGFAAAHSADARGYGPGWGQVCCNTTEAQVDEETAAAQQKFFADTLELRKKIVVKSAELNAQMRRDDPDAKAVGKLTGELFDLKNSMHDKAEEAGIARNDWGCNGPGSRGSGSGPGSMHGYGGMRN